MLPVSDTLAQAHLTVVLQRYAAAAAMFLMALRFVHVHLSRM
jgi:hypothetical protein